MSDVIDETLAARRAFYDRVDWSASEPYQLEVRRDLFALIPEDVTTILDVGCGNGYMANALAERATVVGVDISAAALRHLTVSPCLASAAQLPFRDRAFDLVIASEVIEHLPTEEFAAALGEIQRVAKRYVITAVPFAEDLAEGRQYSPDDAALRHKNDHRRSFDLSLLKNLYSHFDLDSAVFTGAEWQRESRPVQSFNVLLTELAAAPSADFPSETVLSQGETAAILQFLRADQARALGRAPELVDFCRMRTEVVAIYCRRCEPADNRPIRHNVRGAATLAGSIATAAVDLNVIDFRQLDRHQQSWLPTMARFPYLVTSAEATVEADGTRFTSRRPDGVVDLRIGFFCNFEGKAGLEITGVADTELTVSIAHYGIAHDYRQLHTATVNGDFVMVLRDIELNHSQYGMLFAVVVSGGSFLLQSARIVSAQPSCQRPVYTGSADYLYVVSAGVDCFLSCRYYGQEVPVLQWFDDPARVRVQTETGVEKTREVAVQLASIANIVVKYPRLPGQADDLRLAGIDQLPEIKKEIDDRLQEAVAPLSADITDWQGQLAGLRALIDGVIEKLTDDAIADRQQLVQLEERIGTMSDKLVESLAISVRRSETLAARLQDLEEKFAGGCSATNSAIADVQRQLPELKAKIVNVAENFIENFSAQVQRFKALEIRLQSLEDAAATWPMRFDMLGREVQTLRRQQQLRRGTLGVLREILNINAYIGDDGFPKRDIRLPLTVRCYIKARDSRWAASLRRGRHSPRAGRAGERLSVTGPAENRAPGPTATLLVPDNRIDRRVLLSGRSLSKAGWSVTVIAAPYPDPIDEDQIEFPELRIVRIDMGRAVHIADEALPNNRRHSDAWREVYFYHFNFLELALEHPAQVYVANDLPVLPAAAVAAAQSGASLVYDAHELYPEIIYYSKEQLALFGAVEADLVRDCALVTTINQSIADEMAQRYGIATPEILLNAPEEPPARAPSPPDRLRRELQIEPSRRILLYQGALSPYRNLEDLVAAMAAVESEDVVLVMMGPDAERREVLEAIARDNATLGRRVLFRDPVPQRILLSYTAGADVGIVPYPAVDLNSRYCTPNKLFEFIVAGVPILANDLPELRKYVHDTGFGQVHLLQGPAAIAAAIDAMFRCDLAPYRDRLAARRSEFTWDAQGRKLVELYRTLAPKQAAGVVVPEAVAGEAALP